MQVDLISNFKEGDDVVVNLYASGEFNGIVVGVKFQLGKVFYDIDVYPFIEEPGNQNLSFRFRDVDSYFIEPNIKL